MRTEIREQLVNPDISLLKQVWNTFATIYEKHSYTPLIDGKNFVISTEFYNPTAGKQGRITAKGRDLAREWVHSLLEEHNYSYLSVISAIQQLRASIKETNLQKLNNSEFFRSRNRTATYTDLLQLPHVIAFERICQSACMQLQFIVAKQTGNHYVGKPKEQKTSYTKNDQQKDDLYFGIDINDWIAVTQRIQTLEKKDKKRSVLKNAFKKVSEVTKNIFLGVRKNTEAATFLLYFASLFLTKNEVGMSPHALLNQLLHLESNAPTEVLQTEAIDPFWEQEYEAQSNSTKVIQQTQENAAVTSPAIAEVTTHSDTSEQNIESQETNFEYTTSPFIVSGINFINPRPIEVTLNSELSTPEQTELLGSLSFDFSGIEYRDSDNPEQFFETALKPGTGTGIIYTNAQSNPVVFIHSGYTHTSQNQWKPLEGEQFRDMLEGSGMFSAGPLSNWGKTLTASERESRIQSLTGTHLTLSQMGVSQNFTISAIGYIPHDAVEAFEQDISKVVEQTIIHTGNENSAFQAFRDKNNIVYIVFCGWGPSGNEFDTTYSRYVLALEPTNPTVPKEDLAFAKQTVNKEFKTYAEYMLNFSGNQNYGSMHSESTRFFTPEISHPVIAATFSEKQDILRAIVLQFYPNATEEQIAKYINSYPVVLGPDVDFVLDTLSAGSWGTTIPQVNPNGSISFDSISFQQTALSEGLVDANLITQEFFQAQQYNRSFATLYNNGYLKEVANISKPEEAFFEIRQGNMRAFLELIQTEYLCNLGMCETAYKFNMKFSELQETIFEVTGQTYTAEQLLDPNNLMQINEAFRAQNDTFFNQQGIPWNERNIWDLIGMHRPGWDNSVESLTIDPQFILP